MPHVPNGTALGNTRAYSGVMRTQPRGVGLELSAVAVALMIIMMVVLWIERPGKDCVWPVEASSILVLSRETDREHLATDIASADRIARRYMLSTDDRDQEQARFIECEATLVQAIATSHSVSTAEVRAGRGR